MNKRELVADPDNPFKGGVGVGGMGGKNYKWPKATNVL